MTVLKGIWKVVTCQSGAELGKKLREQSDKRESFYEEVDRRLTALENKEKSDE